MTLLAIRQSILPLLGLIFLSACAVAPKPSGKTPEKAVTSFPTRFEVIGKIGVSDGKKGATVNLRWEQREDPNYSVYLSGPFGGQSAKISRTGSTISVTHADGHVTFDKNPEKILAREYGWEIPISGLHYWLHGKPEPNKTIQKVERDEWNRISYLEQNGWSIYYKAYKTVAGFDVPYKITLIYPPIQLHVVLQRWNLGS